MFARASILALLQICVLATQDYDLAVRAPSVADCHGYNAQNVRTTATSLTADLVLAAPCGIYGDDIEKLSLSVSYEDTERLHVKIGAKGRYEVPTSVFPRPKSKNIAAGRSQLEFKYKTAPFSFQVIRKSDKEVLFDTTNQPIVFEEQYLRIATSLPANANLYGLGEHTSSFRLPTQNYTRTLWNRDSYAVPENSNLYSSHPVYYEHRPAGTHAAFLLNSNGMDVKINQVNGKTVLEYNILGGIFDFYFLAGSKSDPAEVSRQYAKIVGLPAEVPWWSYGLHQCRYGYSDFVEVADVIQNYTLSGIPLDTMWTDIDYMHDRQIFSNDVQYFPTPRVREIIKHLHDNQQQYIVMVDPAVSVRDNPENGAYVRGREAGIFVKDADGTDFRGVVWPGVTVYPDWFHKRTQSYWTNEFKKFFDAKSGWDIDGLWIDMNEAASFCPYPCDNPEQVAIDNNFPPKRGTSPPDPNAPIFTKISKRNTALEVEEREVVEDIVEVSAREAEEDIIEIVARAPSVNLLEPPYKIANGAGNGAISASTIYTNAYHQNGLVEYDVHNLYGTMMSTASQIAMAARRPSKRTLVITRSTFAGAGAKVGKWLGDNFSAWDHYRKSIAGVLGFNTLYQVPMVGPDVCGFGGNTTEKLCSRWVTLGAFYPFFRNHNELGSLSQEFYRWPGTTAAAKASLEMRHKLMDYLYTAMHKQSVDGTPTWNPLFFVYPEDQATWGLDLQFLLGSSILVSPVTTEDATSVSFYLPKDRFYDWKSFAPVEGKGANVTLNDVSFSDIPVHIRGGSILPLRVSGAKNINALRKVDYHIVVAPAADGTASGSLFVDDGENLVQHGTTNVSFKYSHGTLKVSGSFGYRLGVKVAKVTILGTKSAKSAKVDGKTAKIVTSATAQTVEITLDRAFTQGFTLTVA